MPTLFNKLRGGLHSLQAVLFASTLTPTNPTNVAVGGPAPEGLELLHTAGTAAEAEMLSEVLAEAGFHMEHVASPGMGIFGSVGNSSVYVRSEEFHEAAAFLKEYLAAEPLPEETDEP